MKPKVRNLNARHELASSSSAVGDQLIPGGPIRRKFVLDRFFKDSQGNMQVAVERRKINRIAKSKFLKERILEGTARELFENKGVRHRKKEQ